MSTNRVPALQAGEIDSLLDFYTPKPEVPRLAADKKCTAAQLALAWVLAQGEDIVAIPGTKRRANLQDNLGALAVTLSAAELQHLDATFPPGAAAGPRYPAAMMQSVNR